MARASLFFGVAMSNRVLRERRCSYVVAVDNPTQDELRDLASYLSGIGVAGCDVVILDPSSRPQFDLNGRILRWVGRHCAVRPEFRGPDGSVDPIRAAATLAACEKVVVAAEDVRYSPEAIARICEQLDLHEAVEPQEYLDPLPWWGGIEAARILVHRGIEPQPDHGATIGFRRSAVIALRMLAVQRDPFASPARRLVAAGAEVYASYDVFVRRRPRELAEWVSARPIAAGSELSLPMKSAFFFSLLPLLVVLGMLGGAELAGGYATAVSLGAMTLAIRGRSGASMYFPLRACLFAPIWVLERSVSVYWALFRRLRGLDVAGSRIAVPESSREQVASGE